MDSHTLKSVRRAARLLHRGMPRGGAHTTKKGAKGYTRKVKHRNLNREN